uniref:DUOXA-like protein C06E1.3 n=1 Tax=Aceria tosichella TaxID=561515 RepID=A0A6G1S9E7_9ACAR
MHIDKVSQASATRAGDIIINHPSSISDQLMQQQATTTTMLIMSQQQNHHHQPVVHQGDTLNNSSNSGGILSEGDPFDGSAEPIVYMSDNRMPVMIELSSAIIYIIFAALLLALISILPGIRRKKMTSFVGLATLLVVGTSILLSLDGSYWLTSSLQIYESPYGALTSETISGKLEVNIGLSSTNVTLYGHLKSADSKDYAKTRSDLDATMHNHQEAPQNANSTPASSSTQSIRGDYKLVDYNERFHWDRPERMGAEHEQALRRGLPYPILTITEFLSQDSDGFNWMRQLRQAGYFTSLALYAALASWCLTALIMCVLPIYLPHMMQITGAIMMSSVWIYTLLIESPRSFVIRLGETPMEFEFGHTYVMTFMAGALSMFSGVMMFILQMNKPHDQVTIMDCDNYVKNQRALYGDNGRSPVDLVVSDKDIIRTVPPVSVKSPPIMKNHSVIIPISDIEEKFAQKTNLKAQQEHQ